MIEINKKKLNAYILAFFIFQFGLFQPIASIVNSQWPIAASTLVLLFVMFLNNNFKIKKYVIFTFLVLAIYFLINALIYQKNMIYILVIFMEFIAKGFSAFIIGSLDIDGEELYNAFLKVAILNFFAIVLFPFVHFLDSMNYMRFGYAMAPSVIMFFYAVFEKYRTKFFWILAGLFSFFLTVVYGSRGAVVVFLVLGFLFFTFSDKVSPLKKSQLLVLPMVILYILNKYNLILEFFNYIYYKLGIQTYAVAKFIMMIENGFLESSSGREIIYQNIWSSICQNPFLGFGVGYTQASLGYTAHNLFLQILIESGVIGLLVWIVIYLYCFYKYVKLFKDREYKLFKIATMVVAIAIGRLLISSDMWLRPEYWFALSILINYKTKKV